MQAANLLTLHSQQNVTQKTIVTQKKPETREVRSGFFESIRNALMETHFTTFSGFSKASK